MARRGPCPRRVGGVIRGENPSLSSNPRSDAPVTFSNRDPPAWGCKPEPQKISSPQFQPRNECIHVDEFAVALECVVHVEQDVPPGRRRHLGRRGAEVQDLAASTNLSGRKFTRNC